MAGGRFALITLFIVQDEVAGWRGWVGFRFVKSLQWEQDIRGFRRRNSFMRRFWLLLNCTGISSAVKEVSLKLNYCSTINTSF